jgi:hypothetical protein
MSLANAVQILLYKESARASARGFSRLHRKIDGLKNRVLFLEDFIEKSQLQGDLEMLIKTERQAKRDEYEASKQ